MKKSPTLLLGAHMSIAKGLDASFKDAKSLGLTCMQIFSKSCRQWKCKPLTEQQISAFHAAQKSTSIQHVMVHASYLINIGTEDVAAAAKATQALKQEIERCIQLSIPYLVLHPGSAGKSSSDETLERITTQLDTALEETPGETMVLLENTAGQGSAVGYSFEQLAAIRNNLKNKDRVGFCFDTCHAFAAGYEFTTLQQYKSLWETFDRIIGIQHLKAMHINDSRSPLASRVDRHAHIGLGKMRLEPFRLIFNDPVFFDIPKILETPKDSLNDDINNINTLISLLSPTTRKCFGI